MDGWTRKKKQPPLSSSSLFRVRVNLTKSVYVCVCLAYSNVENDCPRFFVVVRTAE